MIAISQRLTRQIPKFRPLIFRQIPAMSTAREFHVSDAEPPTQFLEVKDEATGATREIAYVKSPGPRPVGLIYIPGFMSNKSGIKAATFYKFSQKYGFPYVRYDPCGLGESKGTKVTEVYFSHWMQDAKEVLLRVTDGPQLVIGSSMGGWISSLLAEKYPEKFAALLFIAPAINFHQRYEKVLCSQLDEKSLKKYNEGGVVPLYNPDYGSFPLRKAQFEDMARFELSLEADSLNVNCPVRIIHGIKDKDVPFIESLSILKALKTTDLQLMYLKDGDHRLSSESKMEFLCDKILELASSLSKKQ